MWRRGLKFNLVLIGFSFGQMCHLHHRTVSSGRAEGRVGGIFQMWQHYWYLPPSRQSGLHQTMIETLKYLSKFQILRCVLVPRGSLRSDNWNWNVNVKIQIVYSCFLFKQYNKIPDWQHSEWTLKRKFSNKTGQDSWTVESSYRDCYVDFMPVHSH